LNSKPQDPPVRYFKVVKSTAKAMLAPRLRTNTRDVLETIARRLAVVGIAGLLTLSTVACARWDTPHLVAAIRAPDQTSYLFAADGSTIAQLHAVENRQVVPITQVAEPAVRAIVAVEDASFFEHTGVDYRSITRALVRDLLRGEAAEGGSTITQQYVKNTLVGTEKTLSRKFREASFAYHLEKNLSKEEILERYLNTVYFGRGAYGVEAASKVYFGKPASALSLAESALLAGLIKSPAQYDPAADLDAAKRRRDFVLEVMDRHRIYPHHELTAAKEEPVQTLPIRDSEHFMAPYFVDYVRQWILNDPRFGDTPASRAQLLYGGGLRIETTLDPRIQAAAEAAVAAVAHHPDDPYAAVVAIDAKSGAVRALVGGKDFFSETDPKAKFNLATQARRQPGSAFKPFVLATALSVGIPEDKVYRGGAKISIPIGGGEVWEVKNYDDRAYGPMSLRTATIFSVNVVYAQVMREVGPVRVVATAHKMGIVSPIKAVHAVGLGSEEVSPFEMASAFQTLANDGVHIEPYAVSRITNASGDVIFEASPQKTQALDQPIAAQVNDILQDVMKQGTGVEARIGRPAAGKTGTSENEADAWFVGYTPELVASVWVGFPEGQISMKPPKTRETILGGTWPAMIWRHLMASALADTPASQFPPPGGEAVLSGVEPLLNFTGYEIATAESYLVGLGYKVQKIYEYSNEFPPDRVLRQDPAPGTRVPAGGTVKLWVSSLEGKPLPVPNLLGLTEQDAKDALSLAGFKGKRNLQADPDSASAARFAGRVWKQQPPPDSTAPPGSTVEYWVNPSVSTPLD
jgi:penicillin-binding protein 1A